MELAGTWLRQVARLEAEHVAGAVDGEEGFELADLAGQADVREDLGKELGRWAVHHGIRRGDDEGWAVRHSVGRGGECQPACGGGIALVDVASQVPFAGGADLGTGIGVCGPPEAGPQRVSRSMAGSTALRACTASAYSSTHPARRPKTSSANQM